MVEARPRQRPVRSARIILIILGAGIVSSIDNLVRMRVLKGAAGMHPLLTLISVIGGVELMGLIGAFIGPIVAGGSVALILILKQQLDDIEGPLPLPPDRADVPPSLIAATAVRSGGDPGTTWPVGDLRPSTAHRSVTTTARIFSILS